MIFNCLLVFVPISLILACLVHGSPLWVFLTAAIAIIPIADWIRRATDHIGKRAGSAIGGLLNVTFGNVSELLLAIFIVAAGNANVVKGQITGAFMGNGLLGLGLAILVGSWGRERQTFKRERAGMLASMLLLCVIALLLPALFNYTEQAARISQPKTLVLDEKLSLGVSVVLILVYVANLIYTLVTHRNVFGIEEEHGESGGAWPLWLSLGVLAGGTALAGWEAELVSHALEATAERLGISTFFLGVTVLALIGNAAEYVAAVYFARQGRMDLSLTITVGSSIQIALFVAPLLVLISHFTGHRMDLVFSNPLELIAIVAVAFSVNSVAHDGETTWFEGLLLVAIYVLLAIAFFYVTPPVD